MSEPRAYPFRGELKTIREISDETGIPKDTLRRRLDYGMPYDKAFTERDLRVERLRATAVIKIDYRGEKISLLELSERTGIKRGTLANRYRFGDRGERLWRPVEPTRGGKKAWYERY